MIGKCQNRKSVTVGKCHNWKVSELDSSSKMVKNWILTLSNSDTSQSPLESVYQRS